jgi:MlaD protein
MNLRRNETLTGLLVLVTLAVVFGVLVSLSAPGVFHPQDKFYVLFDNAGGIEPGTDVLLAGRHVGQVTDVRSPVPVGKRPPNRPDLEAHVEVRVERDAPIYRMVNVRMQQVGLLGTQTIDFTNGDEGSGRAEPGSTFVGERVASLTDASGAAKESLEQMKRTLEGFERMTAPGSDLAKTTAYMKDFADTVRRQPWRLVWKSTKEYPEKSEKSEKPEKKVARTKEGDEDGTR